MVVLVSDMQQSDSVIHIHKFTLFQILVPRRFVVIHTVIGFSIVNEAEVDAFLDFACFFCDPADVDNLRSGSSAFSKSILCLWKFLVHICWSLGWRILSITLLAHVHVCSVSTVCDPVDRSLTGSSVHGIFQARILEMRKIYGSLNNFWHCLSLELEWKLTFSSPVVTAELSRCANILSATL